MSSNTIRKSEIKFFQTTFPLTTQVHYQYSPEELVEQTILRQQGVLNDTGALCIHTGAFTGRSPQDKFIVRDTLTANTVNWNNFNIPFEEKHFIRLKEKMLDYLSTKKELWIRDAYVCADEQYRLNIRVINENPWSNLFCYNMFLRPDDSSLNAFVPEWEIIQSPEFKADPKTDGTRQSNFAVISFTHKTILIGGTGYTGEMKKGVFTVLNYLLPVQKNVLSMHCSANMGSKNDVAVFFGLSGTGKTTLSTDPCRKLIGDDEHGWTNHSVFNFEGGCYAKIIDLSKEKEPEIFAAVRDAALVENARFYEGSNQLDYTDGSITENTRVSYPLSHINHALVPSIGGLPKHIFFLTCDAYGVLPPISKLTPAQAMYQFISGYTAKVAGTETGVKEPKATFSACFGAPFLPLHPGFYANLLGEKIKNADVKVWLINTGWIGGPYGVGQRIQLKYTRNMIQAALNGELEQEEYETHPVFGIRMPKRCSNVPVNILHPRYTWSDRKAYDETARNLAGLFIENFQKYADGVTPEIRMAAPKI